MAFTRKIFSRLLRITLPGALIFLMIEGMLLGASWKPAWPVFSEVRGGEFLYTVRKNDSLYALAGKEGLAWEYLAELNQLPPPFALSVGQKLKVNNRHIFPTHLLSEGLLLNIPGHMLYVFVKGEIIHRFPVGVGRPDWPTPTGHFHILGKVRNPSWTVPKSIQEEMAREGKVVREKVPPGPDNPLGKYWLPLSVPGYGIHATPWPESVGHSTSHGCIRMVTEDIEKLFSVVTPGYSIHIVYEPIKLAVTAEGKIFLECHPNTYQKPLSYLDHVVSLARKKGIHEGIDWEKAQQVVRQRKGLAEEVTRREYRSSTGKGF